MKYILDGRRRIDHRNVPVVVVVLLRASRASRASRGPFRNPQKQNHPRQQQKDRVSKRPKARDHIGIVSHDMLVHCVPVLFFAGLSKIISSTQVRRVLGPVPDVSEDGPVQAVAPQTTPRQESGHENTLIHFILSSLESGLAPKSFFDESTNRGRMGKHVADGRFAPKRPET